MINEIINNTGLHPAFLQEFCSKLIDHASNDINRTNRIITREHVDFIYNQGGDNSFSFFVDNKTNLNIGKMANGIIATMALTKQRNVDREYLFQLFIDNIIIANLHGITDILI